MSPDPVVSRTATFAVLAVPATALVVLGSAWLLDHTRPWEPARWRTERFVLVAGRPDPRYRGERWVIAVQPGCPHCMAETPALADSARARGIRVAALVVDTHAPPLAARRAALRVDEVWWDADGVWRRRWGHRVYGERMRFDADGRSLDDAPRVAGITRGSGDPRDERR